MHHKRQDQGRKNHKSLRTAAVHRRRKATTPRAMLAGMLIGDDAAGPVVHPSRQAGAGFTRRPALPPPQEEPENGHIKPPLPRSSSAVSGHSTSASCHIVGAGKGWRMPPNRTYYADWASARQISVGDKLSKQAASHAPFSSISTTQARRMHACVAWMIYKTGASLAFLAVFLYRSGAHNIVEVPTRELFDVCSMHNITNRYQNGPTIIELTEPGQRFYFCGVGEHCEVGQKLAINVLLVPPPPPDTDDDDDEDNDDNGDSSGASARLLAHAGAGLAAACMCLASALLVAM